MTAETEIQYDNTKNRVLEFIRERFLNGDAKKELDGESPLLEWGILNSLNVVVLTEFIKHELSVVVPPEKLSGRYFKDVNSLTAMILDVAASSTK
ncbi:acyl carrier protein [Streptomyces sp. NBC_01518]|uniref:acyl carrier protein n=1 Tax=Streptomyces sp. NBC_01518 TaxID=2903891 RepID=UPI003863185B